MTYFALQATSDNRISKREENLRKELDDIKTLDNFNGDQKNVTVLNNLSKLLGQLIEDQKSDRKTLNSHLMGLWILSGINCLIIICITIYLIVKCVRYSTDSNQLPENGDYYYSDEYRRSQSALQKPGSGH